MAAVTQSVPTKEQIEARAYELYLARSCEDGHALEDWCLAEDELMNGAETDSEAPQQVRPMAAVAAAGHGKNTGA